MKLLNGDIWVVILIGNNMSSKFFGNKLTPKDSPKGKSGVKGTNKGAKRINQIKKAGRGK